MPAHRTVAAALAPSCDAVLVGEHQNRPDFPPALLASILRDAGARPWITLACRDRNRIILEQELTGLRHLGVDAVLCVTGDARAYDVRPDVTQVFDLDGPRLAALAASVGMAAAVPETPAAPPRHLRPFRLVQKQRAGAAVAVLNHDSVASVTAFMAAAARAGLTIPVIAAVAVFTDEPSAAVLRGLPGLELDPAVVRRVLDDPDPVAAGIAAAAREARTLLSIPGVAGVNISGLASARGYEFAAQVKAELAARIREERATMTNDVADPMAAEFGTVAEWTAQVAADLGPEYYMPAACRGSGQPAALDWLLDGLRPGPGDADARCRGGRRRPRRLRGRQDRRPAGPGRTRAGRLPGGGHAVRRCPSSRPTRRACPSRPVRPTWRGAWASCAPRPAPTPSWPCCASCAAWCGPAAGSACSSTWPKPGQLDDPPGGNHFPASDGLPALLGRAGLDAEAVADAQQLPDSAGRLGRTVPPPSSASCSAASGPRRSCRRPASRATASASC